MAAVTPSAAQITTFFDTLRAAAPGKTDEEAFAQFDAYVQASEQAKAGAGEVGSTPPSNGLPGVPPAPADVPPADVPPAAAAELNPADIQAALQEDAQVTWTANDELTLTVAGQALKFNPIGKPTAEGNTGVWPYAPQDVTFELAGKKYIANVVPHFRVPDDKWTKEGTVLPDAKPEVRAEIKSVRLAE